MLAVGGLLLTASNTPAPAGKAPAAIDQNLANMQAAYKDEMTATAKYAAYLQQAVAKKLPQLALLYKIISVAETIHTGNHKAVLAEASQPVPVIKPEYEVQTTRENLQDDIKDEAYEAATMYPDFLKAAAAGND